MTPVLLTVRLYSEQTSWQLSVGHHGSVSLRCNNAVTMGTGYMNSLCIITHAGFKEGNTEGKKRTEEHKGEKQEIKEWKNKKKVLGVPLHTPPIIGP